MNKFMKLSFLGVLAAALSACAPQTHLSDNQGDALRANQHAQIFNPKAAQGPEHAVMLDGQKAEQVIKGYRKEEGDVETDRLVEGISR